ncbi:MAG TPA: MFS transporter [Streptosporangiaceae bacterium]|nr:MFS transporter [Streptosporangiaceae bacterium]
MPQESPNLEEQLAIAVPDARADRKEAGGDRRPGRPAGSGAAKASAGRGMLPRAAGFWLVAGVLFLLLFASAAASPLYSVYQAEWHFSATTLTAVFAVYVLVLLVTLLVFGSLSDYLGRRRVMAVALAAGAGACGLFLAAHGVGLLFAARALQGAGVGAATSAAGAALIDMQPIRGGRGPAVTSAAVLLGLGAGGLGTSALVQYAPAPTHLVWWLLLGASAAAAVAVLAIPETAPRRHGVLASLRPRVAVPRQARGTLAVALPCMIAAPALNGFYLSLGPSLAAQVLRSPDLLWGGLVIFLVAGTGAAASVAFRVISGSAAMLAGCLTLLAGAVMTLAAIETASAAAFLAGTAVAGAGVGTGFFAGAYRLLTALADPGQRAGLVAAIWIVFYLAFSVPVVAAGVATTHFGLHQTAVVYSAALAVLAATAAGSFLFRKRSQTRVAGPAAAHAGPPAQRNFTEGRGR